MRCGAMVHGRGAMRCGAMVHGTSRDHEVSTHECHPRGVWHHPRCHPRGVHPRGVWHHLATRCLAPRGVWHPRGEHPRGDPRGVWHQPLATRCLATRCLAPPTRHHPRVSGTSVSAPRCPRSYRPTCPLHPGHRPRAPRQRQFHVLWGPGLGRTGAAGTAAQGTWQSRGCNPGYGARRRDLLWVATLGARGPWRWDPSTGA
jgi:hypothetical protein